jgi:hypothetical protein
MISYANSSADDEVHLKNFFLLVLDDILVLLLAKVSGLQAKGNVVKKLAIFILLVVEEETEVVENVIEEIVHNNSTLNAAREDINQLFVFLKLAQSVVGPVILEMLVDLPVERVGQGLVLSKASEKSHPVVQLESLLFDSQVLLKSWNDFNETSHYEKEETNTTQHNHDAKNLFSIWNWVQVAITNGRKSGDTEIARGDELVLVGIGGSVEAVCSNEGFALKRK